MLQAVSMLPRDDLRNPERAGSLYLQPLYDAQILILLAAAYELGRDSGVYTAEDERRIVAAIYEAGTPYRLELLQTNDYPREHGLPRRGPPSGW